MQLKLLLSLCEFSFVSWIRTLRLLLKKDSLFQPYWTTSILNIKIPMQLTIKLSKNKCYQKKRSCAQNCSWNYFSLSGLLNYLSNKLIQIKSFFYNNFLRELSSATDIGTYINSQRNFSFIQHDFIFEFVLSYYIVLLPKYTTICM